jgi:Na+/H+ antiporter NhaC
MLQAERRARSGGPLVPTADNELEGEEEDVEALEKPGAPARALNAVIPIGAVLAFMLWSILDTGGSALNDGWASLESWKKVFDTAADDIGSILFSSALAGSAVAVLLALGQKILSLKESLQSYFGGIWALAGAAAILILAWAIKSVCDDVGTGTAMVALVGDSISPIWLPLAIFLLSGVVAFSTGTSWGTMALVLPIAAPLAADLSGETLVVLACLGSVLDGAIWGDHCSPISDTTVLSSTACGCPHLAHVKTQLPYACLAMVAAGGAGYFGVVAGLPIILCYVVGLGILVGGMYLFGEKTSPVTQA